MSKQIPVEADTNSRPFSQRFLLKDSCLMFVAISPITYAHVGQIIAAACTDHRVRELSEKERMHDDWCEMSTRCARRLHVLSGHDVANIPYMTSITCVRVGLGHLPFAFVRCVPGSANATFTKKAEAASCTRTSHLDRSRTSAKQRGSSDSGTRSTGVPVPSNSLSVLK